MSASPEIDVPPAMRLGQRGLGGRSYVLPEHKVMFISVAKNACTSVKWLLADLAGENPERFHRTFAMVSDPADTIHQRQLWEHIEKYDVDDPDRIAEIHPDNGWFVFGLVRDPHARLFSAWQSKFLNHDPWYARYRDESFYPDLPRSTDDVRRSFADFVRWLADNPEHKISTSDTHFQAQSGLLQSWRVNYSRIYNVREVGDLLDDLGAHLATVGRGRKLKLPRDNSTPLRAHRFLFSDGVRELIDERFAADLAEFGSMFDFDRDVPDTDPEWSPEVFRGIGATASAYDQIAFLTGDRVRLDKERQRLLGALEAHRTGDHSGREMVRALAGKVKRRLGG